jgi:macrolide transport system ATP-binding/permease protein
MARWIYKLPLRVGSLFRKRRVEQELTDELRFHLEKQIEQNLAKGMGPEEARYAALRELGGVEQIKEECRDMRRVNYIETFLQDVRYGVRQLRRSPGVSAVIILSLALGIGADTAIFSLIDTLLLRNLPVRNPQQLMLLEWAGGWPPDVNQTGPNNPPSPSFSYRFYTQLRTSNRVFSSMFAFAPAGGLTVKTKDRVSQADGYMVTGQFFSTLGVAPLLGRAIDNQDEKRGAPGIAVLSYDYWTREYARSPSAIGQTVALNGAPYTIVGVLPKGFFGVQPGDNPDVYIPLIQTSQVGPFGQTAAKGQPMFTDRHHWWLMIIGRLKPGVSRERALAELSVPFLQSVSELQKSPLKPDQQVHLIVASGGGGFDVIRTYASEPLHILMAIVCLLLLVACANVAALLLARSTTRGREIAMRLALGASRSRLIRQLLTESVMMAAIGGALGLLAAYWGARALGVWLIQSGGMTMTWNISPDVQVLAFTAAVSVLTGILFGLAPAFRLTRVDLTPALKGGVASAEGRGRGRGLGLGKGWVTAQVAISLVLLVGAGLFVCTLNNLEHQDFGFNPRHLLIFGVDPTQAGYKGAAVADFYRRMLDRIQGLPGVESVTYSTITPLSGNMNSGFIALPNKAEQAKVRTSPWWNMVGPDFLKTIQIPLLLGRDIQRSDTASAPHVAVVNEAMARAFFGKRNPIGRRILLNIASAGAYRIVGVAANAKYSSVDQQPPATVYFPLDQTPWAAGGEEWEIRTAGRPTLLVPVVRQIVYQLNPGVPVTGVQTEADLVAQSTTSQRMFSMLSSFFGLLALLLAAIGLNGVVSYAVKRRTNEIGIRMALGATRGSILAMILKETMLMVFIGVGIGIPVALELTRLIKSQLYGVKQTDPTTFALAALLMTAVALFSGYLPARRASRVDPLVALRYE